MADPLSILLPALLAGLVAIGATVAIERWGGVVGGLLSTLPTTIVPASLGIWDTSADTRAFAEAMAAVAPGMLLDVLFLYLWRALPPRLPQVSPRLALGLMLGATLTFWLGGASLIVLGGRAYGAAGGDPVLLGAVTVVAMIGLGLLATWTPRPAPRGSRSVGPVVLVARGLLAAAAIAFSVWLAGVGGAFAAGVASVFPAIFITTMVALWISQGVVVQGGAVGPMMLGASSVATYALLAAVAFPLAGPWLGGLGAWLAAVALTTVPAFLWIRWRAAASVAA